MARPRDIPEGAEIVRTYEKLHWFLEKFAELCFTLRPINYIRGHARPIQVYISLFFNRGVPVILDDAECFNDEKAGRNVLMSLAQTDKTKTVEWLSSSSILDRAGVPMRFTTTSKVCIITNHWTGSYKEIEALNDRGHLIYFDPAPDEIHRHVGTWLEDTAQDVFDFIGEHLHLLDRPTCRLYRKAVERKNAGGDWKEFVLHHCHDTAMLVVQRLMADPTCRTEKDRVAKAKEEAGISRATYFRCKKELLRQGQKPPIQPYKMEKIKLKPRPAPEEDVDEGEEMAGNEGVTVTGVRPDKPMKLLKFCET